MGKETNFGITKRFYPELDIDKLKIERAKEIYYNDYWLNSKCDKLPNEIRLMHFDTAVNMGVARANKFLQKIIGVKEDGIIGNVTLKYAHKANLKNYTRERLVYYVKIILNKPSQLKYINGWFNRVIENLIYSK